MRELETLGAEVLVVSADVTDLVAMTQALDKIQRRFGTLHGVIHAAGVLRDGLMAGKSQSDIEEVFTPKIHGTLVLDELLRSIDLDFLVAFSSTSTAIAPAGQVDYVAANAFLNAYAQSRSVTTRRQTLALNWGIWSEVGMTATGRDQASTHAPACEPTKHPLFETRCGDQHAAQVTLSARLSPSSHWLLDEHRTATGQALIPGTGYLELMRAALVELGVRQPFEIADLYFLRPLAVADSATKKTSASNYSATTKATGARFKVASRSTMAAWVGSNTHKLGCCSMRCPRCVACQSLRSTPVARVTASTQFIRLCTRGKKSICGLDRVGTCCAREVAYGEREAIAKLELPDAFRGDLPDYALHPALMDLATGYAMDLIAGYDQCHDLWVPVSYQQMRVYGPLPQRIVSWVRNHGDNRAEGSIATFDITITDETGRVLVEIREFSIKRLAKSDSFALDAKPSLHEVELEANDTAHDRQPSAGDEVFAHNLSQGITPIEGVAALERVLRGGISPQVIVSSLDVPALITQTDRLVASQEREQTTFTRPKLESEFLAPRDDVERTLAGIWQELWGVNEVGIHDNFFELGGHSLIAVRLFARIKKTFAVDFPMSILFEAPTIAGCAELIRESGQHRAPTGDEPVRESHRTRYAHLVAMHEGSGAHERPLFIVAGMFGNVLNLRHLAHLVGQDRPCYGLQARGLYGEHPPHETFEEAATDYLRELRSVQPHGPYLLGGFSGGGLHAYEMARQLIEQGEEVAMLVMLDTPLPVSAPLTFSDKVQMHLQKIAREKGRYFTRLIGNRIAWEITKWRKETGSQPRPAAGTVPQSGDRSGLLPSVHTLRSHAATGDHLAVPTQAQPDARVRAQPDDQHRSSLYLSRQRLVTVRDRRGCPRSAGRPRQHGPRTERARAGCQAAANHSGCGNASRSDG